MSQAKKFAAVWFQGDENKKIEIIETKDILKFIALDNYDDHQFLAWRDNPSGTKSQIPIEVLEVADTKEGCEALVANRQTRYRKKKSKKRLSEIIQNIRERDQLQSESEEEITYEKPKVLPKKVESEEEEDTSSKSKTVPKKVEPTNKKGTMSKQLNTKSQKEKSEIINKKLECLGGASICFDNESEKDDQWLLTHERMTRLETENSSYKNEIDKMKKQLEKLTAAVQPEAPPTTTSRPTSPHEPTVSPVLCDEMSKQRRLSLQKLTKISRLQSSVTVSQVKSSCSNNFKPSCSYMVEQDDMTINENQLLTNKADSRCSVKRVFTDKSSSFQISKPSCSYTYEQESIPEQNENMRKKVRNDDDLEPTPSKVSRRLFQEIPKQCSKTREKINNNTVKKRTNLKMEKPKGDEDKVKKVEKRIATDKVLYESDDHPPNMSKWYNDDKVKMMHLFYGQSIPHSEWEALKHSTSASKCLRRAARQLWTVRELSNRSLDLDSCKKNRLPHRSPRKICTPVKLACIDRFYYGYVNDNYKGDIRRKLLGNCHEYLSIYINSLVTSELKEIKRKEHLGEERGDDPEVDADKDVPPKADDDEDLPPMVDVNKVSSQDTQQTSEEEED